MTFLIYTPDGNVEVPVIERFTHFIAGQSEEFVTHEYQGTSRLTHYRTGFCWVTSEAPPAIDGCIAWLDQTVKNLGERQVRQRLNEPETINPPTTKEEPAMSLEQAIAENTAAVRELIAALAAGRNTPSVQPSAVPETSKEETPAARKARLKLEKEAFEAEQKLKVEQELAAAAKAAEVSKVPTINFDTDVKPLLVQLSKDKGREAAVALLQRFGCSKSLDLLPEQYADCVKFANEILAGSVNPEDSDI